MKILITGGSGFIGRNLREFLSGRHECLAPGHKGLDLMDEVAVSQYFRTNKFDVVIHAAGVRCSRNYKDPQNVAFGNLRMFSNIARNSACFSKMIFLGSGSEYDQRYEISGVKEEDSEKRLPADELGFSKWACSKYIEKSDNIISLRLFGVFGKYEHYQIRFISNAICKAIFDLPITIKQNRVFSYLYIDDLCKIIEYFINNNAKHRVYNVAPPESVDLLSIAGKVKEISKKDVDIIVHAAGMGKEYTADSSLIMGEIGDFRFTPLEKATKELYGWYEENKNSVDRGLLLYDP